VSGEGKGQKGYRQKEMFLILLTLKSLSKMEVSISVERNEVDYRKWHLRLAAK
jgi:hypothetical protein